MRLHSVSSLLTALVFSLLKALVFLTGCSTSPLAYPNEKLEEINALRAQGVSEVRSCAHIPCGQRLLNADRLQLQLASHVPL